MRKLWRERIYLTQLIDGLLVSSLTGPLQPYIEWNILVGISISIPIIQFNKLKYKLEKMTQISYGQLSMNSYKCCLPEELGTNFCNNSWSIILFSHSFAGMNIDCNNIKSLMVTTQKAMLLLGITLMGWILNQSHAPQS